MDSGAIKAAQGLTRSVRHANAALEGLRNSIVRPLLNVVAPLVERFAEWVAVNRRLIASNIAEVIGFVGRAMGGLFVIASKIVDVWREFPKAHGWILALGAAVLAMLAPWTAVAAAIALVGEDIYLYFTNPKSVTVLGYLVQKAKELSDQFKAGLLEFADDPFGKLKEWGTKFFNWFVDQFVDAISELPQKLVAKLKGALPKPPDLSATGGVDINDLVSRQKLSNLPIVGGPAYMAYLLGTGRATPYLDPLIDLVSKGLLGTPSGAPQVNLTVNAGQGVDGKTVGRTIWDSIKGPLDEWWDGKMSDAHAATNK
jgi:hypothetical protein